MKKINGRLNIDVAGVVSDFSNDSKDTYMVIDGEKVYIHNTSSKLFSKIKKGEYVKLECYIDNGRLFATGEPG